MRLIMPILAWLCLLGTALPLTGAALAASPARDDAAAVAKIHGGIADTQLPE
jgi:hypothetical protein